MTKKEVYVCDLCGEVFFDRNEYAKHEEYHIYNFKDYSNDDLVHKLLSIGDSAYDFRFGDSVLGMHYQTFTNLMCEVAKRLGEAK